LYRDSDIEGMSDGFDPMTAYGESWVLSSMGRPGLAWVVALRNPTIGRRLG
jgi:hypothetical protein